jgi:hypothetical protein
MPAAYFRRRQLDAAPSFRHYAISFQLHATGRQFIFAFFFAFSVRFTLDEISTAERFHASRFRR